VDHETAAMQTEEWGIGGAQRDANTLSRQRLIPAAVMNKIWEIKQVTHNW
jgi:hypothetical protein